MFDYSERALDHFRRPRNVGTIENPDAVGQVGSLACGQMLRLTVKLDAARRIAEARFQAFGCASAIAAASALTEMVRGKTIAEAERITGADICEYLHGLPEPRAFCGEMVVEALRLAVTDYREKNAPPPGGEAGSEPRVLDCRGLACPLNFVKVKVALDRMRTGETLHVLLNEEGARNVPRGAEAEGHRVQEVVRYETDWKVIIQRGG